MRGAQRIASITSRPSLRCRGVPYEIGKEIHRRLGPDQERAPLRKTKLTQSQRITTGSLDSSSTFAWLEFHPHQQSRLTSVFETSWN